MRTDRRGFLRIAGRGLAALWGAAGARGAAAGEGPPAIHAATSNTYDGPKGPRSPRPSGGPFKPYAGAPRLALGPLVAEPGRSLEDAVRGYAPARGFEAAPLSLEALGRLLYFANGVTERRSEWGRPLLLRAAPSAGALYAGEVYVVAERVRGLEPGVYYYSVDEHELVTVRRGAFAAALGEAVEQPQELAAAPVFVLLTNVFARYGQRYANRGYRYCLIDTGHIGENLRLAAVSAGLGERASLRFWDARLNALLGVDGRTEAVCALHAVGPPGGAPAAEVPSRPARTFTERGYYDPGERSDDLLPERFHAATQLLPGSAPTATQKPEPRPSEPEPSERRVPLPPASAPAVSVERTIRTRRSATRLEPEPISREALSFALEMARGHRALERSDGVELYLAAHRVSGLARGLYRYRPADHTLAWRRLGDLRRDLVHACAGQEKAGEAAVACFMVARLDAGRAYRGRLVEAGAVGQRIYLAAEALGMAARNLSAFFDSDLDELVGVDGIREGVVHLTVLGPGV